MQKIVRKLEIVFVMTLAYGCAAQATQSPQPGPTEKKSGNKFGGQNSQSQLPPGALQDKDQFAIPIKAADGTELILKWSGRQMQGNDRFDVLPRQ